MQRYAQKLMCMFNAGSLRYMRETCTQLRRNTMGNIEELGADISLSKLIEIMDVQVEKLADYEVSAGVSPPSSSSTPKRGRGDLGDAQHQI